MSKVIMDAGVDLKSFTFANFTEEAEAVSDVRRKQAAEQFKPSYEVPQIKKEDEFVMGGFDFDVKGGYRRDEILKKTSDEIDNMLAEARARVEGIERDAFEKGHAEGLQKGKSEGYAQANSLMNTFEEGLAQLATVRGEYYAKAEKEMLDLVMLVAAEIVQREIAQDPSIIQGVLKKAVLELQSKQSIVVRVNPRDMAVADHMSETLRSEIESVDHLELKEDPAVTPGGCLLETNIGRLDATVENRFLNIHKAFRAQMES